MSDLQNALSDLALAVKAKLTRGPILDDTPYDPYESAPMRREDLETLFEMNDEVATVETAPEPLRQSEQLERQTMSMIRGALYAD